MDDKPRVKVEPQADRPGVVLVTLDRPEVLNALDYRTLGELVDALERLDSDDSVRCVVITGAGDRAFAAGADIKEMADATPVTLSAGEQLRALGAAQARACASDRRRARLRAGRWVRARDGMRHGRGRG